MAQVRETAILVSYFVGTENTKRVECFIICTTFYNGL